MSPTSGGSARVISASLEQLYLPATLDEFPKRIFRAVETLVPDACSTFDEICLQTGAVRGFASFTPPPGWTDALAATLARDHPAVAYVRAGGTERVLPLWDLTSRRRLQQTQFWHEVFRPLGMQDQVAIVVPVTDRVAGVAVNRASRFNCLELDLLRLLAPHLRQAYHTAKIFSALRAQTAKVPGFASERLASFGLTPREVEVLQWLVEGKRDREIAVILAISGRTVEKHVSRILAKLKVETRGAAITQALAYGR